MHVDEGPSRLRPFDGAQSSCAALQTDAALGDDNHCARSQADQLLRDAAEQQARQLAASATAYDDHLARRLGCQIDQGLGDVTPARPNFNPGRANFMASLFPVAVFIPGTIVAAFAPHFAPFVWFLAFGGLLIQRFYVAPNPSAGT